MRSSGRLRESSAVVMSRRTSCPSAEKFVRLRHGEALLLAPPSWVETGSESQSVVPFHFTIGPDPRPLRLRPDRGGAHLKGESGMRGVAPAAPLVCRPAPPDPPVKGRAGSARHGSDERRRMRTKSRCKTRTLVRDRRGIHGSPRSFMPTRTTKDTELQVLYGSDGTRTRDLRRDRLPREPTARTDG